MNTKDLLVYNIKNGRILNDDIKNALKEEDLSKFNDEEIGIIKKDKVTIKDNMIIQNNPKEDVNVINSNENIDNENNLTIKDVKKHYQKCMDYIVKINEIYTLLKKNHSTLDTTKKIDLTILFGEVVDSYEKLVKFASKINEIDVTIKNYEENNDQKLFNDIINELNEYENTFNELCNTFEKNVLNYNIDRMKINSISDDDKVIYRNKNNTKKISNTIINTAIASALTIAIGIGTVNASVGIANDIKINDVNKNITEMVNGPYSTSNQSIVDRNAHRTTDKQGFWYDNYKIAEDILSLPDDIFEETLYNVYINMGLYRKTSYVDNISRVIFSLNTLVNEDDYPTIYSKVNGCNTFDDYLIKNGFVDENGLPSEEEFIKYSRNKDLNNHDQIEDIKDEYEENYFIGGR